MTMLPCLKTTDPVGIYLLMFYQHVTLKNLLYMFRTELYRKASQRLWSQWLSFLYFKWHPLFLNQSQKSKKFYDVRKRGDVQQTKWYMQKLLFYYEDFAYQASELKPMLSINKVVHEGWYVPSVKTTTYICNRFNTFCTKDHKTHLAISSSFWWLYC